MENHFEKNIQKIGHKIVSEWHGMQKTSIASLSIAIETSKNRILRIYISRQLSRIKMRISGMSLKTYEGKIM